MSAAARAVAQLGRVSQLADEHGAALQRAYELVLGGALVGPGAEELYSGMAECHRRARQGFYASFDEVRRSAVRAEGGAPRVAPPRIPGPPGGPRPSDDVRSGSPEMLERLGQELARAGAEWQKAGAELVRILGSLELDVGPGDAVRRAGRDVAARRREVHRRREGLLRDEQTRLMQSAVGIAQSTAQKIADADDEPSVLDKAWDAWAHHYMPGLWVGVSEIGKQALATNPLTAPFYLVTDPKGWFEQAVTGPANQLLDGLAINPMTAPFYYIADPDGWSERSPVSQFKGFVNWGEWRRDPVRALGHTIPNVVLTALTLRQGTRRTRAPGSLGASTKKSTDVMPQESRVNPETPTKSIGKEKPNGAETWTGEGGLRLGPEENAAANRFLERARAGEKSITPRMKEIAADAGGELEGLEYSLKTEESLKRKVADRFTRRPGTRFYDVLKKISDSVRYTVKLPENGYVDGVRRAASRLRAQGYEPVAWKNTWGGKGYQGINSTWRDPGTGHVFEVQFHTQSSFSAKMVTHEIYEKIRLPSTSRQEAAKSQREQDEIFGDVPVPAGAPELGPPE